MTRRMVCTFLPMFALALTLGRTTATTRIIPAKQDEPDTFESFLNETFRRKVVDCPITGACMQKADDEKLARWIHDSELKISRRGWNINGQDFAQFASRYGDGFAVRVNLTEGAKRNGNIHKPTPVDPNDTPEDILEDVLEDMKDSLPRPVWMWAFDPSTVETFTPLLVEDPKNVDLVNKTMTAFHKPEVSYSIFIPDYVSYLRPRMDANQDGKVSRFEFVTYFKKNK